MALGPKWYAPPARDQPLDPLVEGLDTSAVRYGGIGIRFAARALDAFFVLLLWAAGGFVGGLGIALLQATRSIRAVKGSTTGGLSPGLLLVGFALGWLVYCVVCEAVGDATLGKWICALRTRRAADLGPCGLGAAIVRNACFPLDCVFIGPMSMGSSPRRERLGDGLAGTYVVVARTLPETALRSAGTGSFAGCAACLVVYAATLVVDLTLW